MREKGERDWNTLEDDFGWA